MSTHEKAFGRLFKARVELLVYAYKDPDTGEPSWESLVPAGVARLTA